MTEHLNVIQPEETQKGNLYWNKIRHNTLGIILIIIGTLFLVERASLIEFTWPLILLVVGSIILVEAWLSRRVERIFPGILIMLFGVIFQADTMELITGGVSRNWPLVVLALSLSLVFSAPFLKEKKKYWRPGVILLAIGGLFLLVEYGFASGGIMRNFLDWWPFSLLLIGIWFLLRKGKHPVEIKEI